MKNSSTNIMHLAVMLLLVFALSGCALGGRRLNSTTTPDLSQTQQNQPTISPGDLSTPPSPGENITPATEVISPDASSDAQAEDLLNLINTLDAANQAGDSLEDLP
jgi:predicted S18 family serine protease